jgi:hypothetical protein
MSHTCQPDLRLRSVGQDFLLVQWIWSLACLSRYKYISDDVRHFYITSMAVVAGWWEAHCEGNLKVVKLALGTSSELVDSFDCFRNSCLIYF